MASAKSEQQRSGKFQEDVVRICFKSFSIATESPEPQPFRYDEDSSGRVKVVPYAQVRILRPAIGCNVNVLIRNV